MNDFRTRRANAVRRCSLILLLALPWSAPAQDSGDWVPDSDLLAAGNELLLRTPQREMDGLFQAVHAAAQVDAQAQALCALFEPDADRGLAGLNAFASRLDPDSQQRFADAVASALIVAWQSPLQSDDRALGIQALKSAGVTAAILHDGFVEGLNATGNNADSRHARCQSLRWLIDAMQSRPLNERAAMTRLLLSQGLAQGQAAAFP